MIEKNGIDLAGAAVSRRHGVNRLFGIPPLSRAAFRMGAGFALALLVLWGLLAAPAAAQTELWSATMTIEEPDDESGPEGYCSARCASGDSDNYGSLSVATFVLNSTTYTVHSIRYGRTINVISTSKLAPGLPMLRWPISSCSSAVTTSTSPMPP